MNDEYQLTPEALAKEEKWKKEHGYICKCWKCMYVCMPWIETLSNAQNKIEQLEYQLKFIKNDKENNLASTRKLIEDMGYKLRELQTLWRTEIRESLEEIMPAILDALNNEGVVAWPGDATSCVEQMIIRQICERDKIIDELKERLGEKDG